MIYTCPFLGYQTVKAVVLRDLEFHQESPLGRRNDCLLWGEGREGICSQWSIFPVCERMLRLRTALQESLAETLVHFVNYISYISCLLFKLKPHASALKIDLRTG